MGLLSGAGAAAVLIFGLFAGAWVDRLHRRPILIGADLGRAVVLAITPLAAMLRRPTMGDLYLVAVTSSTLTVLFDVSYQAYLPSLIEREQILTGNSRLALTESIAQIAGPGIAGPASAADHGAPGDAVRRGLVRLFRPLGVAHR